VTRVPKERRRKVRSRDPLRYAPVGAAAEALVAELVATYDVQVQDARGAGTPGVRRAVRLVPARGATIILTIFDDGRVDAKRGHWDSVKFPLSSSLDWDESADVDLVVGRLRTWVLEVVRGYFAESLSPEAYKTRAYRSWGWSKPARDYARMILVAPPGLYDWPAWPRRGR